jgi:putative heme-binding domain-containing protein
LFDRKLTASDAEKLSRAARIEGGRYVSAGDRFETIRPGYQAVYDQLAEPRYLFPVSKSELSEDGRVLSLFTKPRTNALKYAVTMGESAPVDLLTDLTGVRSTWKMGGAIRSEWQPHLDTKINAALERPHIRKPGLVTLAGKFDLFQMLQPAIQPGASIDWVRPSETVIVHLRASVPFTALIGSSVERSAKQQGTESYSFDETVVAPGARWVPYKIEFKSPGEYTFTASWSTVEDKRERPFPLRRLLLPWAQPVEKSNTGVREVTEISGGNWQRGRELFFGAKLACYRCHAMRGEGAHVGPDLSNLTQRDYASVRKDIEFPNAAINPDHVASKIELADGDVLTAIIQKEDATSYSVADSGGATKVILKSEVKSVKPSTLSLMPEGLWGGMTDEQRRDLMTFLLRAPTE